MDPLTLYMMQMRMANPLLFQNSLFANNLQQIFKNNININLINSNNYNISANNMNPMQFPYYPQQMNMNKPTNIIRPNKPQTQKQKPKQTDDSQPKKDDKSNILNYIYGGQVN
jgi:hypothetical protein